MCARRGAANKSDANARGGNGRMCMRPGPITRNGYLNFLREYRQKHCGLSVVETVRQGAAEWNKLTEEQKNKYTQMGCMIGSGQSTNGSKCMRPGPLTRNGYLNYLRDYRKEHCGLTAVETVRQGAAEWNKLSEEEKNKYTQMGCRIGGRRSRSRRSASALRRSRSMFRGGSRSRRSASAHQLSGKIRSRSRSRQRPKSRNSSSQRRRATSKSTSKSGRSSSAARRSSSRSMPTSRRSMVCHISPLHRTKRRSLKSAPSTRARMRKSRLGAGALSSRRSTAQNRPKSRRSIVCHRMTT